MISNSINMRYESTYPKTCCIISGAALLLKPPEKMPSDKNKTEKFCIWLLWFFHVFQPVFMNIGRRFIMNAAVKENGTMISAIVMTKSSSEYVLKNITV